MNLADVDIEDVAYLIRHGQQEVVEEDGAGRELIVLAMGLTQGIKEGKNDAHVDRVPGDQGIGKSCLMRGRGLTGRGRLG